MHWYQIPAQISKLSRVTQGTGSLLLDSAWYFHETPNKSQTPGDCVSQVLLSRAAGQPLLTEHWRDVCPWGAAVQRCTSAPCPCTNPAAKAQLVRQLGLDTPRCAHSTAWSGRHLPARVQRENLRGITPWSSTVRGALSNTSLYHPASRCSFRQFSLIHQGTSTAARTTVRAALHTAAKWHGSYVFSHLKRQYWAVNPLRHFPLHQEAHSCC